MKKTIILLLTALLLLTATVSAATTLNLTVQQAVTLTLQNNPQLQQVLAKRDQVFAQVGQAEAGNWPTVTLTDNFQPWSGTSFSASGWNPPLPSSVNGTTNNGITNGLSITCLLYTSPSPRD